VQQSFPNLKAAKFIRVSRSQKASPLTRFLQLLGPGFVTGALDVYQPLFPNMPLTRGVMTGGLTLAGKDDDSWLFTST
jgi:hypothetical protein